MKDWLTGHKIPLGKWISDGVDLLNVHAAFVFDAIAWVLDLVISGLVDLLQAVPAVLLVLIFAGGAFVLHRSWKLALLIVLSLLLVINLG